MIEAFSQLFDMLTANGTCKKALDALR
ncbi:protein of unknown function [Candidatus Methylomirabilis oxygeniifera]|uniref:Uncharacterized protein n=1 Tax=Methylomirabilis oxygeniifera TaxID=671143 RepID=D5MG69_METO1|nr:protein of unknown function [Candidatus Methylomirabilis oxyfera]